MADPKFCEVCGQELSDSLAARLTTAETERDDWRTTVWEHLVTDLTDDGVTTSGYGLADIPHDILRDYVVDVSGAEARVEAVAQRALENAYAAKDATERVEAMERALETLATAEDFVDEEDYQAFARAALACPPQQRGEK